MTFPKANRRLPMPANPSDSRRQKAFRVPFSFLQGQLVGIQSDEPKFNVYRITPGLLPEGFKIVGIWQEHNKESQVFLLVEHPSFDPVPQGAQVPLIEITIDEIDVRTISDAEKIAQACDLSTEQIIEAHKEHVVPNSAQNRFDPGPGFHWVGDQIHPKPFYAEPVFPTEEQRLAIASHRLLARQKGRA